MLAVLLAFQVASTEPLPGVNGAASPTPPRDYGNLRIGGSTAAENGRPTLCLELSPIRLLSIEGCGTGGGFLHHDAAPDLTHFRGKVRLGGWHTRVGWIEPMAGLGFGELEVGADDPGFHFTGPSPSRTETAGAEVSLSVRTLYPLGRGIELVVELGLYCAYLPYAPDLIVKRDPVLPSLAFSAGFGF